LLTKGYGDITAINIITDPLQSVESFGHKPIHFRSALYNRGDEKQLGNQTNSIKPVAWLASRQQHLQLASSQDGGLCLKGW
jgi:hypothetical protein